MIRFIAAAVLVSILSPSAPAQVAKKAQGRAAEPAGPYEAQVSCHRSMGGRFEKGRAVLAGGVSGAQGRFVFDARTCSFQAADGTSSGEAVVRSLNEALLAQARAVESADPGSYMMSRCPELVPAPPPTDY